MRAPRILMLSDVYFPRVNGVSTSIQTFRRDLAAEGCTSVLVAGDFERAVQSLHCDFDLIHVHTPFVAHVAGLRLARRLDIPVVESYHTFFEEYFHHYLPYVPRVFLRAVARSVSRRQCNAVDAVVAPSPQRAEALRAYGVRYEIRVIPTGLDTGRLGGGDGARFRELHGIPPDRPVALTVGRVAFEKNIGFLLPVLDRVRRSIPDVVLIIAGEGPALAALQRQVNERGLADNVRFVGYLDRSGPPLDCYRSATVFVFASRTETQGLVLLEAMALGLSVVDGRHGHAVGARRRRRGRRRQRG
jgi:1,2-diacylglycerol 3-alpha-glucosyltransferase